MQKEELIRLKQELLKAMKSKQKYPLYGTTSSSLVSASDLNRLEAKNRKNSEKNKYYTEKINEIQIIMEANGYPIKEILDKWDSMLRKYKYDLTEIEKIKLILLGKKYPSLKKVIMNDINLDSYVEQYDLKLF